MPAHENQKTVRRFRSHGLWGGAFLGVLIGVALGAVKLREWEKPLATWLAIVSLCATVGAVVGYLFLSISLGGTPMVLSEGDGNIGGDHPGSNGGGDGGGGGDGAP